MAVASVSNLYVRYGRKTVISDLTLDIPEGCCGLLGPNGAGKTTLLKSLLGFLKPSGGQSKVLNLDVATQGPLIRQRLGVMPEIDCHIPGMNAVSFVAYAGELAGMPGSQALRRAHEVLEYCGLGEARYRNVETYSTGMKQRIKLAQALVHGPKLLFLDEPTNGLDPSGREEMLTLVREVSHGKGLNVVVCSHLLPDIERTCDSVIVLQGGQVKVQGDIGTLRNSLGSHVDVELREHSPGFLDTLKARGARVVSSQGPRYRVAFGEEPKSLARELFSAAETSGAQLRGFRPARRTLEDVFLEVLE
ncbi:MAG TPA: ABC transporter ATP-binding protein [Armatimonadota bacterium]|jgi:ABC-2 type transport system ATP-binding protein